MVKTLESSLQHLCVCDSDPPADVHVLGLSFTGLYPAVALECHCPFDTCLFATED